MVTRRRLLVRVLSILAIASVIAVAYPFLASLKPNAAAKAKARIEIDPSKLAIGEVLKHQTQFGEYWVIRRSADQIQWLLENPGPYENAGIKAVEARFLPSGASSKLRSIQPEFFVFEVWRNINGFIVFEGPTQGAAICKDIVIHSDRIEVDDGEIYLGGIDCEFGGGSTLHYNLAGRAANNNWFWPLPVPEHEFHDGKIYLGPAT